jgi:hypothetical protein
MSKINLTEDAWVNRVLDYRDPLGDMTDLVEFVRLRWEAGDNLPDAEAEYDAWVDAQVAAFYGA